jgi:hypothetical protein
VQAGLGRSELDGGFIFCDGVDVAVGFCVGLRQHAMHSPRLRIDLEHLSIAVFRNQQVRAAAVVQDIRVARFQFVGFVEGLDSRFGMIASEIYHTEPHPGVGVSGKADCLLLDGY